MNKVLYVHAQRQELQTRVQELLERLQEQRAHHEAALQMVQEAQRAAMAQLQGTIESLQSQLAGRVYGASQLCMCHTVRLQTVAQGDGTAEAVQRMLQASTAQHQRLEEEAQRAQRQRADAEACVQGLKEAVEEAKRAQHAAEVGTWAAPF